jgi:hypothetical protein
MKSLLDFYLNKFSLNQTKKKLMGLENTNTIAIIRQTKHQAAYLRWGVLGVLIPSLYATSPLP